MHSLILKMKDMLRKPRARCRAKIWVDSGSISSGVRNLPNLMLLLQGGLIEIGEGVVTIKNVTTAIELVILRESANQEEGQEIEMTVETEEGAGLHMTKDEEVDPLGEVGHQEGTAMTLGTQENIEAENTIETIEGIETTIEEIDLEIMTGETEGGLDQGQDLYLDPLLLQEEKTEDQEVQVGAPQNQ